MSFQVRRIFTRELNSRPTLLSTLNVYNFTTTSIRHVIVRIVSQHVTFFFRPLFIRMSHIVTTSENNYPFAATPLL
jgi:hypothetical protein